MRNLPQPRPVIRRSREKGQPPRFALQAPETSNLQLAAAMLERGDLTTATLKEALGLVIAHCEETGWMQATGAPLR